MSDNFHYNTPEELTTREYEELEDFLMHESELKHPMSLDALDGFMTALIIGPETVTPGEWLPHVWGSSGSSEFPRFQSETQEKRILELIRRMMNSLVYQLEEHTSDYVPLPDLTTFENDESRRNSARMWCLGFIEGMNMRPAAWNPLLRDEKGSTTIFAVSVVAGVLRDKLTIDEEKEYEIWKLIPDAVLEIRQFWLPRRQKEMEGLQPTKADEPGRNDLCPCGSGKKFKKCCGK